MKTCTKCGAEKPLESYYRDKRRKDGVYPQCKDCKKGGAKARRQAQAEREGREYIPKKYARSAEKEGHKVCTACEVEKPLSEYHKRSASKDGLQSRCKACMCSDSKVAYHEAAEKEGRTVKIIKARKPAEKEGHKVCASCDVEKPLTEYHKNAGNSDGVGTYCKACKLSRGKAYSQTPSAKTKRRARHQVRMQGDPCYRLRGNISSHVRNALHRNKGSKLGQSIMEHLPYTIEELREHLESQFTSEMSWDNYGSFWHIDHIYPQSKLPYDRMDHPNFQLAWSLDNLQPLEATLNISKGAKLPDEWEQ